MPKLSNIGPGFLGAGIALKILQLRIEGLGMKAVIVEQRGGVIMPLYSEMC